jgi:hypothetical protein
VFAGSVAVVFARCRATTHALLLLRLVEPKLPQLVSGPAIRQRGSVGLDVLGFGSRDLLAQVVE